MEIQFIESNKDDLTDILNVRFQGMILYKIESNVHHIKNNVAKQLEATGRFDVRNTKFESIEDIIAFCRLFRAPRYETFRIIYMQNNVVIGQDAVTAKLPGVAPIEHRFNSTSNPTTEQSFNYYKLKYDRLKATGYYLLHNHPSGHIEPSEEDCNATDSFKSHIDGFIDHLIVGLDKAYSMETGEVFVLDEFEEEDKIVLSSPQLARNFISTLSHKEDYSIIIYLNSQLEVVAIQDIYNKEFNDSTFHNWLRKEKIKNGATSAFLYTDSFEVFNKSVMDVNIDRQLTDSFYTRKNGVTISASDYGKVPVNKLPDDLKIYNEKFPTS